MQTGHEDMIHDAQLDYYGRRLATASSDRTIRLFDVEGEQDYRLVDTLRGCVTRVEYAPADSAGTRVRFMASAGPIRPLAASSPRAPLTGKSSSGRRRTPPRASAAGQRSRSTPSTPPAVRPPLPHLTRARARAHGAVNAIAWAPHELGPILACASSDGKVSVLTFNSSSPSLLLAVPV